jgi:hypothetical protein
MIRYVFAAALAAVLGGSATHAQPATDDANRYQFNQVDDGYLRLDLKTGEVSLCKGRAIGWSCVTVADERAALDGEIARLQGENAALKKALLDRGLPLPGSVKPEPPVAAAPQPPAASPPPAARNDGPDLRLPSDAEIDRMMAVVQKIWRRMTEMMASPQNDPAKKP